MIGEIDGHVSSLDATACFVEVKQSEFVLVAVAVDDAIVDVVLYTNTKCFLFVAIRTYENLLQCIETLDSTESSFVFIITSQHVPINVESDCVYDMNYYACVSCMYELKKFLT